MISKETMYLKTALELKVGFPYVLLDREIANSILDILECETQNVIRPNVVYGVKHVHDLKNYNFKHLKEM